MPNEALALARLPDLAVFDVSAAIPTKHFPLAKSFYVALGWKVTDIDPTLAIMELAGRRIYLQNFYTRRWADYAALYIGVQDAYAWYDHLSSILKGRAFPGAYVQRPITDLDGSLVTRAHDPSGVALHFTQWEG